MEYEPQFIPDKPKNKPERDSLSIEHEFEYEWMYAFSIVAVPEIMRKHGYQSMLGETYKPLIYAESENGVRWFNMRTGNRVMDVVEIGFLDTHLPYLWKLRKGPEPK